MSGLFCFSFACDLKEDTPQQVIDTLKYMTRTDDYDFNNSPAERFFEGDEWKDLLRCGDEGYHFPGEAGSSLRSVHRYNRPANQGGAPVYLYTFSFRSEGKDDSLVGFGDLVEWVAPFSETEGFVGYWVYEDFGDPTLIYIFKGQTRYVEVPSQV